MEELKSLVSEIQVSLRIAHQVNRESVLQVGRTKKSERTVLDRLPELHHLAESGATEQFANRVITLAYADGRMYFAVRKNRNGPAGRLFSVRFDIDLGNISEERLEGNEAEDEPQQAELHPVNDDIPEEPEYPF
jgi:hypothetical protein